jgi:hypothetical protein
MVVPLLLLGTVTKLAIAIAATHRTRLWWIPGVLAIGAGVGESLLPHVPREVGEGTVMLGACAVVISRLLRPRVASAA